MKINLKTITLIVSLGTLSYFLSNKKTKENKQQDIEIKQEQTQTIDKKSLELPAPKPYISIPAKNGLGVGNNWKSK